MKGNYSLIGAIIQKPEILADMRVTGLRAQHFISEYEKIAFMALENLQDGGDRINFVSVDEKSREIIQNLPIQSDIKVNPAHFNHYLKESINQAATGDPYNAALVVKSEYDERVILKVCDRIKEAVKRQEMDTKSIAVSAIEKFQDIFDSKNIHDEGYIDEAIEEACNIYEKGHQGAFISTGMRSLDQVIIGWQVGELTIVAAATGQGKSAFVLNAIYNQHKMNRHTCLVTLEMSRTQCIHRLVSNAASINSYKLINGGNPDYKGILTHQESQKAQAYARAFNESKIRMYDPDYINLQELKNIISTRAKQGHKLFFIDQLSHIQTKDKSKIERYINIAMQLKALAKNLKVAIILLHQISKQAEKMVIDSKGKWSPSYVHMRDAPVENDAAVVLMLHREEKYMKEGTVTELEKGVMTVKVSKNRYGRMKNVNMNFKPQYSRLTEL